MELAHNGWIYRIEVVSLTPHTPAKIHAAPEDCYPEEGPEIQFIVASITPDGDDYSLDDLINEEEMAVLLLEEAEQ